MNYAHGIEIVEEKINFKETKRIELKRYSDIVSDFCIKPHDLIPTWLFIDKVIFEGNGCELYKISGFLIYMYELLHGCPYKIGIKLNLVSVPYTSLNIEIKTFNKEMYKKMMKKIVDKSLKKYICDDVINYIVSPFTEEKIDDISLLKKLIYETINKPLRKYICDDIINYIINPFIETNKNDISLFKKEIYVDMEPRNKLAKGDYVEKLIDHVEKNIDVSNLNEITFGVPNNKVRRMIFMFFNENNPVDILKNCIIDERHILNYVFINGIYLCDISINKKVNLQFKKLDDVQLHIAFEFENFFMYNSGTMSKKYI